jgi:coniferyl-aldehyde dehydrogenase
MNETSTQAMRRVLNAQRNAFLREGRVLKATRTGRLQRAIDLVVDNDRSLCEAMSSDFGHRSATMSRLTDIAPSVRALKYARDNLEQWMADEVRPLAELYAKLGAKGIVRCQPKGVVGNISTWNAPVNATLVPLAGMLAAGNRVMIKPSENTPETAELLARLLGQYFDETEVAAFPGGIETSRHFARLPFDHLLFTGSTEVGKLVLAAAAENLCPVTLELGGKSPVIVGRSADISRAADRIVVGKLLNAGQICVSPDFVFVHKDQRDALIAELQRAAMRAYPHMLDNSDYCSIINDRQRVRLDAIIRDASVKGAHVIAMGEGASAGQEFSSARAKRSLALVVDPGDDTLAMQEEIFGPILPIRSYEHVIDAVAYVNSKPRPLGLYYFGTDPVEEAYVLSQTVSGGVTVNDVMNHVAHEQLPFGGIGPSGMGAYHGVDGFRTFSHARTIYRQTDSDLAGMAGTRPPYGAAIEKVLANAISK